MNKTKYTKPFLTFKQQVEKLKSRGLIIDDECKAIHILSNISYYRLSAYMYPFLKDKENHVFKSNSTFDDVFNLYSFDKELRKVIFNEIEKIEISIRTQIIYILSREKDPFWINDPNNFKPNFNHSEMLDKLKIEIKNSDEQFIKSFKVKYNNEIPPTWISLELLTFGSMSKIYKNLNKSLTTQKREISNFYGLSDTVFESWIHCLSYLRNICAHHSRLWNRDLGIEPIKPRTPKNVWLNNSPTQFKRIYVSLSIIRYFLITVQPNSTFSDKIKFILNKYPKVNPIAMGFPLNWEKENLWK